MVASWDWRRRQANPLDQARDAASANDEGTAKIVDDLMAFFGDRLKVYLKDEGTRHDLVNAVMTKSGQSEEDDIVKL